MTQVQRRMALAMTALAAVGLVAGCSSNGTSSGGDGVVQLSMLTGFTGPDAPGYVALVKDFNASHPKIHVTMTVEPWATIGQKLPEAWATGQGPDIAAPSSDPGAIFDYIKTNSALNLTSAVGSGPDKIDDSAFPADVRSAFTVKGQVYAVPANLATLALYYNKTMFQKAGISGPPTTQAQFIADATKLTIGGSQPTQYGLSLADNNTIQMWPILQWMGGGEILGANNCSEVDSAASVAALSTWSQLVIKDHISPIGQAGADADTLFASKKAAMELNGPWAAAGYRSAGIDLGIAPVPVGSAGPVTLGSTVPLMIERQTKHAAQAETFLAWYESKTAQTTFSNITDFPPTRSDLATTLDKNPKVAVFANALPYSKLYLAGLANSTEIDSNVYVPFIQKIERGANVESAANAAAKQMNSLTGCS